MRELKIVGNRKLNQVLTEIGGEARVREILKTFYRNLAQDTMIGYLFDGFDLDHIADQQAGFLLRSAGITQTYTGKTPDRAHDKVPQILTGHFDRRLVILKDTLASFGLNAQQIEIWVDFEDAFRPMIVRSERDCR